MVDLLKPNQTFCGVPFCEDPARCTADVAVFGSPHGTPYKPGKPSHAAGGAAVVRQALGWYSSGREQFDFDAMTEVFGGAEVVDCGDVNNDLHDDESNRRNISAVTGQLLAGKTVPVLLGGDDSVPIPFIQAFGDLFTDLTVLQVDAHIDWRDEIDGVTHGFSSTMRRASEMDHVKHIVQIGARGPGSARRRDYQDAVAWGAKLITARDVRQGGVHQAIDAVPTGADVVLAVDVDGIDPTLVPAVILPAFGGLDYQDLLDLIHGVADKANIVGADFVEFVPEKDPTGRSAQVIARLVSNVVAAIAGQRS